MEIRDNIKDILHYIGVDPDHVYRVEIEAPAAFDSHTVIRVFRYAVNEEGKKYLNVAGDAAEVLQPERYEISNRKRGKHEGPPTFIDITAHGDWFRGFIEGL